MGRGPQSVNVFDWLESLFPDWQISDNHQRFLNLICGWDGGVQPWQKMPPQAWNKIYSNWLNGKLKPEQMTEDWECLPK